MRGCRVPWSQRSAFGWEEYDDHVDELLDGSKPAASSAALLPPTAAGSAAEPAPSIADAAGSIIVLSDGSEGSDWNDDDIMMTLSDGAREYDANATVRGSLCPLDCHHDLPYALAPYHAILWN